MKYISLFSGVEAATVAWEPLGWVPMAFAEIDPFPCAVLRERFPQVPNLGNVTEIDWSEFIAANGRPDVVVGGSPCQSFSIAGRREGLAGASGLMFEYIRAVRELMPRWFVWENVPGALTSEHGSAFGQLLAEMDALGYSQCWRVLDAQFFGVAQRRERVFLVGRFGGEPPAEVLFERESLPWDFATSRKKREELTAGIGRGTQSSVYCRADDTANAATNIDMSGTLTVGGCEPFIAFAQNTRNEVRIQGDGTISGALAANPGMKQTTYVCETAHTCQNGLCVGESSVYPTLDTSASTAVMMGGCLNPQDPQSKRVYSPDAVAPTLSSGTKEGMNIQPSVLVKAVSNYGEEIAGTLTARYDSSPCADRGSNCITTT